MKLFLVVFLLIGSLSSFSEESKFRLQTGLADPEILYVGASYKLTPASMFGVNLGFSPTFKDPETKYRSYTLNYDYFFGDSKKFDGVKTWYAGIPLSFKTTERVGYADFLDVYIGVNIGRQFNLSKRSAIGFDLGVLMLVNSKTYNNEKGGWREGYELYSVAPSIGLHYFFRF